MDWGKWGEIKNVHCILKGSNNGYFILSSRWVEKINKAHFPNFFLSLPPSLFNTHGNSHTHTHTHTHTHVPSLSLSMSWPMFSLSLASTHIHITITRTHTRRTLHTFSNNTSFYSHSPSLSLSLSLSHSLLPTPPTQTLWLLNGWHSGAGSWRKSKAGGKIASDGEFKLGCSKK